MTPVIKETILTPLHRYSETNAEARSITRFFSNMTFKATKTTAIHPLLTLILLTLSMSKLPAQPEHYSTFDNLKGVTQKLCIRSIVQTKDGMMWLAAEDGLYSYDGYHLSKRHFNVAGTAMKNTGSFNCMSLNGDSLLIGCNRGMLSFNLKSYDFRILPYAKNEIVKAIIQTSSTIWTATSSAIYKNGIKLEPSPTDIVSLAGDDRYIYIGTAHSVLRYSIIEQELEKITDKISYATCLFSDPHHKLLWIGTANSISLWNSDTFTQIVSMKVPVAKSFCYDNWGNMLAGTDNGLYCIGKNRKPSIITHDSRRENSLAGDAVWHIYRDDFNNVWLGTNSGLSLVSGNGFLSTYSLSSITGDGKGNQFFCTLIDSNNHYWLGGTNGLLYMEQPENGNRVYRWYKMNNPRYPLPHNRVRDIFEDSKGTLYIGGDMGLMRYNKTTQQFKRTVIKEDPYNWIYKIKEPKQGELAVTTFSATYTICSDNMQENAWVKHINPKENLSQHTKDEQILMTQYGIYNHYLSAYHDSLSGMILMGGNDRFSILDTKKFEAAKKRKSLGITDIKINDARYAPHTDILQGKLTLHPGDNSIEIMFSDFNYSADLSYNYLYRLNTQEWIPVHSTNNTIMLTNLNPGTHKLTIRASNNAAYQVEFIIQMKAPWYLTTFAKIMYLLTVICILSGIHFSIRQRKRIHKERLNYLTRIHIAMQKEKELLSDNENLSAQLRIQFLAKSGDTGELSADEKLLVKITTLIEDNLSDAELNVNSLSELSGINSKQLYRKIKAMTGLTAVAYIRDQRIKKAASLLAKGNFTVSEVMYMVGFTNPSYFTRCFTEEYNTSPSEYKTEYPENRKNE